MRDQLILLRETPWDVLIILDACRADYFGELMPEIEVVRSAGPCTRVWIRKVRPVLERRAPVYFVGCPVVEREINKAKMRISHVPVHDYLCGQFTEKRIPSVHPFSINGAVLQWLSPFDQAAYPIVVHYLQPHSPYIGQPPLALSRWGDGSTPVGAECAKLMRPDRAVEKGLVTWEDVRAAYRGNVRLVLDAVRHLVSHLEGLRIAITADHGEVLGEDGRFGHECNWTDDVLFEVPWLEVTGGEWAEPPTQKQMLEALGYV